MNSKIYRIYTEIYGSIVGYWRMAGNPLPHVKFGSDPGVWCNGFFYSIIEMPYRVVRFDLEKGAWTEIDATTPCSISTMSLATRNGCLIIVERMISNLDKATEKKTHLGIAIHGQ
jgi:hypothetical protein